MTASRIALVGGGVIGRGWAVVFARAGHEVALYDVRPTAVETGLEQISEVLKALADQGVGGEPTKAMSRIRPCSSIAEAVQGAVLVQESVPEDLVSKRTVLTEIDRLAAPEAIVASSCSSLAPERLFDALPGEARCLVAHPCNPPYLLPLVELVAGPRTSPATTQRCHELMTLAGQRPVVLRKSVLGYVVNRLQAAVINEAMSLVAAGVIAPEDLDVCMTDGLGRRWSIMGPFETMDTNADDGISGYFRRYGTAYQQLGQDLNVSGPWPKEAVDAVTRMRRKILPLEAIAARVAWRDGRLAELAADRDKVEGPDAVDRTLNPGSRPSLGNTAERGRS